MVHAMRALSGAADTLLSVMEVFINEPLLDWNKEVATTMLKQEKQEGGGGGKNKTQPPKPAAAAKAKAKPKKSGRGESAETKHDGGDGDDDDDDLDDDADGALSASQVVRGSSSSSSTFASVESAGAELRWLPQRKIHYAREKLHRGNPAHIMRQEFRDSAHSMTKPAAKQIEQCILPDALAVAGGACGCG